MTLEENVKEGRPFKVVAFSEAVSSEDKSRNSIHRVNRHATAFTLAELYDHIRKGNIVVEWL